MCPGGAPVAGGVRRWRPGACTCGPNVPCSGAKCRSAPQMILNKAAREGWSDEERVAFTALPVFERRPETLSVEDFIDLTNLLT